MNSNIPQFFYGTAWKEEQTAALTLAALRAGFTAIDTANQRKHYFEEAVGQGFQKFLSENMLKRDAFFLQTKYTFARGQDHRKPYNENDSFTQQVKDSFQSSLVHLGVSYIDSYVLHGPFHGMGIGDEDLEAWQAMEELLTQKKVQNLGVSNVSAEQLMLLCEKVETQPKFVQNRCYARMGWDKEVRDICQSKNILYQGFSLLTANATELSSHDVSIIAQHHHKTIPQVTFRFCRQLGMICLTGTNDAQHMIEDLDIDDFELTDTEVRTIENISF